MTASLPTSIQDQDPGSLSPGMTWFDLNWGLNCQFHLLLESWSKSLVTSVRSHSTPQVGDPGPWFMTTIPNFPIRIMHHIDPHVWWQYNLDCGAMVCSKCQILKMPISNAARFNLVISGGAKLHAIWLMPADHKIVMWLAKIHMAQKTVLLASDISQIFYLTTLTASILSSTRVDDRDHISPFLDPEGQEIEEFTFRWIRNNFTRCIAHDSEGRARDKIKMLTS